MFGEKKTIDIKSVLIIGLGRFGHHAALQYTQLGCEVMAVDIHEERVNQIADSVNSVVIGDTTNEAVLKSLGVSNFDLCLVTIGSDFESSLITTALLKAAIDNNIDYAIDVYHAYSSDVDAALGSGYDVKHCLIGPGVYASHGYERTHIDGIAGTARLMLAYRLDI